MGMLLTDEERRRFSDWCLREAETQETLVKQLQSIGGAEPAVQHMRAQEAALRIVHKLLSREKD